MSCSYFLTLIVRPRPSWLSAPDTISLPAAFSVFPIPPEFPNGKALSLRLDLF